MNGLIIANIMALMFVSEIFFSFKGVWIFFFFSLHNIKLVAYLTAYLTFMHTFVHDKIRVITDPTSAEINESIHPVANPYSSGKSDEYEV